MSNQKGQDHRKNIQQTQFNGQNGSMQPSLQQNFFQQQQYQQTQQLQIQQLQQQDNQQNLTNTQNNEQNGFVQPNLQQDLLQQKQYQQIQQLQQQIFQMQQQFYQQKTKNMATLKTNNNTQNEINQLGQTSKMNTDQKNGNLNEKQATLIKTIESEKKNQPFSKDQLLTNQKELNNKDFYVKKKEIEIIKSHQSQKGYYVKNDEINQKKETTNRTKKFQINDNKENKINENESKKNNKFNKLRNENGNENDEKLKDENDNSKKNQDEEAKENIHELQDENKLENKNKQLLQGNNNQIETIIEKKKYIKENDKGIEINDNKEKEKDEEKEIKGVTKDEDQFKEYESQNKETTINKSYKNEKNQETEQQEIKYFPQQAVDDNSRYSDTPMDKKSLFSYFFSDNEPVPEYVNNRTTPIRSVAINPKYPKKKKVFAVGLKNGDIIIASSGMMRSKVHIISQDEGQIYSIDWKGSYIVWASTNGISVYSIKQKMLIGNYKESILFPQSSLYHSIFHWISERRFIVAWSTFFKVFKINTKKKNTSIMCIKNINFDSVISGVCKYKDLFIVLSGEDEEKQILIKKTEVKITNLKNQSKNLKGPLKDNNSNNGQNIIKEYVTIKKRELIKKYPPKITFISNENFQIVSKELIEIGDYDKYCYFDYRIDNSNEQFFLVSPMKIYIGRLRRIDEVVDWLLEKNRFHEALKIGRNNISKLKSHQINDIGFQLLMYYIKNDYWEQAAIECKDICKNNHNLWIDIIEIFLQHHKFKYLYKCIPMKSPQFSRKFYEKILINCINDRLWDELIYCVQFWPTAHYSDELLIPTLKQVLKNDFFYINPIFIKNLFYYDTKFIENSQNDKDVNIDSKNIEDGKNNQGGHDNKTKNEKSDDEKENEFLKVINCLFQLYYYCENYYPVLIISVYYKFINPYNLITQYKLFSNLELLVIPLIKYDHKKTINFFVKHSDQIPIEMVINEFEKKKELNQYYLYEYLDALFEKSPKIGEKYHFLLFKLYSEYNRSKIFDILNLSTSIPLDKAVLICKKKNFFEETVKIYDMMGNYIDCLKIKLTNCENMESIIKYVESKKDKDLWHQLIDHCLVHPKYLSVLLEKLPRTGIDFLEIVNKIPKRTKIDQLKENICNIILDRQIFIELMKVTNISIKNDSSYLLNLLNQKKQSGVLIDHTLTCSICQLIIKKMDTQYRIFNCGHYFHENCLTQYLINSHEIEIGKPLIKKNQKKKKNSVNVLNSVNKSITPPIQQISFFCVICQKSNKDPFW
ncbi:vacuolar protein sorting-associated protein [Anaeramoeba flamelloides]|uniref:Vacuolar protein sorting-associated protein n=1 Tax=Anaeramoeba flamelloides TaxID=1746091 RepID=A0ABQ8Z2E3_9EUKA|nr:vacuolar protein sorting-associated protein [Anaeramoeba flamelloides]